MEVLKIIKDFFSYSLYQSKDVNITIFTIISLILAFIATNVILKILRKLVTKKIAAEDSGRFLSVFQFFQYLMYLFVIMFTLNASGVNISVLLTASAAIFLGLGFALQQLFQDLISGILMIVDQSMKVDDIIEIEGRVCRVEKISLRSTKAVTRNNRVMIIPNHIFMSNVLFNWTQNSKIVREDLPLGVAYGSDTQLVKKILLEAAAAHPDVLNQPKSIVLFEDFGDSALKFTLYFFVKDPFFSPKIKSDLRFALDKKFRENNINIPFPQRTVHLQKEN
jgi:small-conductance mechanosensitive channel